MICSGIKNLTADYCDRNCEIKLVNIRGKPSQKEWGPYIARLSNKQTNKNIRKKMQKAVL